MENFLSTSGENIIGHACSIQNSVNPEIRPLILEVNQYDDEYLFSFDKVVTFNISSWSADRFRQFWEFMHSFDRTD